MPSQASRASKRHTWRPPALAVLLAAWMTCGAQPASAAAANAEDAKLDRITFSGNHNAYEKSTYGRLTDGLDAGSRLLEIDVYTDPVSGWVVSHSNPVASDSNCTRKNVFGKQVRNGDLADCLTDMRRWSDAHPGHDPVYVKLEMKWGFYGRGDMAPEDLDRLIAHRLGSDRVFTPGELTGTAYTDADTAARAGAWPTLARARGKFLFYVWPGTVEGKVFEDNVPTDVEYGRHVRDRAAAGRLPEVMAWPATRSLATRSAYEPSIAPWFVLFNDSAGAWLNGDPLTYCRSHYLLTATSAQSVTPPGTTDPTPGERLDYLGEHVQPSVMTHDWTGGAGVFGTRARSC
ncbi:Ca2+-dependent phosphoinositide-specific phospholipase C [Streptomyces sp. NPDC056387]|uniref:Ca2+-dependent phosphoinositide-specific phospholipase C n=1 Tax=Streptomyces sp. NPDC056387 TaxID=3345803 RepID=UPI0035E0BCD4